MARKRRSKEETKQVDSLVERRRDFVRFNYVTAAEVAREIGVNDSTVYSWLLGQARPAEPKPITAFLDSFPRENGSGIAPVGYEYREYKNWRGIPKPRRCPFCKKAKGEIRRKSGGFAGVCPNCDARGPKRDSQDEALRAWNGKGLDRARNNPQHRGRTKKGLLNRGSQKERSFPRKIFGNVYV
jgi:hypothetical protein